MEAETSALPLYSNAFEPLFAPMTFIAGCLAGLPLVVAVPAGQAVRVAVLLGCAMYFVGAIFYFLCVFIVLLVLLITAVFGRMFLNTSIPQMACHLFLSLAIFLVGLFIGGMFFCFACMVEMADRVPKAVAGFLQACLAICLSIACCSDQSEMFKQAEELIFGHISESCVESEGRPSMILFKWVPTMCLWFLSRPLFTHGSMHMQGMCLKLETGDDSQNNLADFYGGTCGYLGETQSCIGGDEPNVWLLEGHWPTGVCTHAVYKAVYQAAEHVGENYGYRLLLGVCDMLHRSFVSGFFTIPHRCQNRGREACLTILRWFGYGDLYFWMPASRDNIAPAAHVLTRTGQDIVTSVTDGHVVLRNQTAPFSDLWVRAGPPDKDGPIAVIRNKHPVVAKVLGVIAAMGCCFVIALDAVYPALSYAGCDRWVLGIFSRIVNFILLGCCLFAVGFLIFAFLFEFAVRLMLMAFAFAFQVACAAAIFVFKPALCVALYFLQFMAALSGFPLVVVGCASVFAYLIVSAFVMLAGGFALAVVSAAAGIVYGTPFIGTFCKAMVACGTCGSYGGKLDEFGCKPMAKYAKSNFQCVMDPTRECHKSCLDTASGIFPGWMNSGFEAARGCFPKYDPFLKHAHDFSLASSVLNGAFGTDSGWWHMVWLLPLLVGRVLRYMVGFTMGCFYRVRSPHWMCADSPSCCSDDWPWFKPHGGVAHVTRTSASYSHHVAIVRGADGHYRRILRQRPENFNGELLVVGRPLQDPGSRILQVAPVGLVVRPEEEEPIQSDEQTVVLDVTRESTYPEGTIVGARHDVPSNEVQVIDEPTSRGSQAPRPQPISDIDVQPPIEPSLSSPLAPGRIRSGRMDL